MLLLELLRLLLVLLLHPLLLFGVVFLLLRLLVIRFLALLQLLVFLVLLVDQLLLLLLIFLVQFCVAGAGRLPHCVRLQIGGVLRIRGMRGLSARMLRFTSTRLSPVLRRRSMILAARFARLHHAFA